MAAMRVWYKAVTRVFWVLKNQKNEVPKIKQKTNLLSRPKGSRDPVAFRARQRDHAFRIIMETCLFCFGYFGGSMGWAQFSYDKMQRCI